MILSGEGPAAFLPPYFASTIRLATTNTAAPAKSHSAYSMWLRSQLSGTRVNAMAAINAPAPNPPGPDDLG
jgi:hypothetical protein